MTRKSLFTSLTQATNDLQALADTVDGYALRDQLLGILARFDGVLDDILDEQAMLNKEGA